MRVSRNWHLTGIIGTTPEAPSGATSRQRRRKPSGLQDAERPAGDLVRLPPRRGVQVIAAGHRSEPLRFYRRQSLSHWVYCQQGVLQRDHSQQAGFILLCECHLCREDLVL